MELENWGAYILGMPEKGALLISHITPNLISHIHQIWAAQSAITEIHMEFTA